MLGIKDDTGRWKEWHINEDLPEVKGQVITFQADGDELHFLLACFDKLNYDKRTGTLFHNGTVPTILRKSTS